MMNSVNVLLAYVGPDTMLPLASVLAAAAGGILFCWRWIVRGVRSAFSAVFRSRGGSGPDGEVRSDEMPSGR